jgi:predicted aminopeptidase
MTERKRNRIKRGLLLTSLLLAVLVVSGCQTITFYSQALKGQYQIFAHQEKIETLLGDPQTPAKLRDRLQLVQSFRTFARDDLKLPVDGHYRKYVDVHRRYVVWNVEAAPEFSLQPKTWWYPLVGSLEYRGYFSKRGATNYGAKLEKNGYDVFIGGVQAYSTLGWFKDPLLNTFVFEPEADLAEILFHELGHQRVFARGDTDFNEAFATTVGQEGARRWLRKKGDEKLLQEYEGELKRTDQFVHLIMNVRQKLKDLYGDELTDDGKFKATNKNRDVSRDELRKKKRAILAALQVDYSRLKASWNGNNDYDGYFARQVNNAQLNSVAAYYDFVPGFEHLLAKQGGDLEKFYVEADRLAQMPKNERHQWLQTLATQNVDAVPDQTKSNTKLLR